MIDGHDIANVYSDEENIADGSGSLNGSCMNGCDSDFFDIYSNNAGTVQMLIKLNSDDLLIGRALIWKTRSIVVMDRIYGSDSTIQSFRQYAIENKIWCKAEQNYSNKTEFINPETGEKETKHLTVSLDTDFSYFPYIDTFTYGDDGSLNNSEDGKYKYDDTSGEREESGVWDEVDNCYINEDDSVWVDSIDGYTHYLNAVQDYNCDNILKSESIKLYNGDYAHRGDSDIMYCDGDNESAHIDDTFICEYSDMAYIEGHTEDSVYLDELEMTVARCNVEDAYEENGYVYIDDEWIKENELETA